jgi:hypothetical protein
MKAEHKFLMSNSWHGGEGEREELMRMLHYELLLYLTQSFLFDSINRSYPPIPVKLETESLYLNLSSGSFSLPKYPPKSKWIPSLLSYTNVLPNSPPMSSLSSTVFPRICTP